MRTILVRHCEAAPGSPDELRALTPAGRAAAKALGERLAEQQPAAVLCSPLLRARETAEAIAEACGIDAETDARLAPGARLDGLREAVAGRGDVVVAVGHQPDCGEIAAAATGEPAEFPPGGTAVLEL